MPPASDVIRRRGGPITITRPVPLTVVDGYVLASGPAPTVTVIGTIQPLSGQELRNLPPGQNAIDWRSVWALSEIKLRDRITVDGQLFTIEHIDDWAAAGGFWRGQAVRVKDVVP